MARDVKLFGDVQIDYWLNQPGITPELRAELMAEKRRRAGGGAPNVQSNLDASATPIPVEPMAGDQLRPPPSQAQIDEALIYGNVQANGQPAGPGGGLGVRNTPEDLAIYGEVVRDANRRATARMRERVDARLAGGYRDPRQEAYDAETGVMPASSPLGDTVMVDGVEVPVRMRDGAGRPMTTIGDERRAMEAAAEADWQGRFRANQDADRAKYGDWRGRTPEQAANYEARNAAVDRSVATATTARNRPGLQQLESDARDRRRLIANRAMLAGGSSGLRGGPGGNMGMFTALAMLQGVDPATMDAQQQALVEMLPINPDRAKIEAARNAQLTELGLRTAQGRGFQQPDPAVADAQAQARRDKALAAFNSWHDANVGTFAGDYTWDRFEPMVNFLMAQYDLTRAEAEAIAQSRGLPRGQRAAAGRPNSGPSAPPPGPAGMFPEENEPGGLGTPM